MSDAYDGTAVSCPLCDCDGVVTHAEATEYARLRAVVAVQREALRPFVAAFDFYVGDTDNEYRANVVVTGAQLRAARAALDTEGVNEPGESLARPDLETGEATAHPTPGSLTSPVDTAPGAKP